MKKSVLITLAFFVIILASNAQTENKNIIKVFPTSFVFGKATVGYERVINENGSITFNLGLPTGINPMNIIPIEETEGMNFLDGKLDGLLIMPGYRFNFSKKGAPLAFYIEPYLKYEKFNVDFDAEFIDDENERFLSEIDGSYSGFGAGFQMGFQFFIGDVVSVEWSFFGLEAKLADADFTYTDLDGGVDIDDVYDEIESSTDIPVIGNHLEFEKGSNYIKGKASNLTLPGFRSAISIGIAF